jgi:hypothetical protein
MREGVNEREWMRERLSESEREGEIGRQNESEK